MPDPMPDPFFDAAPAAAERLRAVLHREIEVDHVGLGERVKMPMHRHLSFLVAANGGFRVRGWGITTLGGSHQQGLGQEHGIELMQFGAWRDGLILAGVDFDAVFKPLFDTYKAEFEQPEEAITSTTPPPDVEPA